MTEERQSDESLTIEEGMDCEPDETARLRALLEEAEREREQFKSMALRFRADLDNYKKRAAQEMSDTKERANARLLLKLISVADDFGRALSHMPEDTLDVGWLEGVRLVQRSMESVLRAEGVARIEAVIGQPFDVSEHEAVFFEPTDEVDEGAVARVVRDGYKLHNRVLRAAQVSVAQTPPQPDNQTSQQQETQ